MNAYFVGQGQINMNSLLGKEIFNLCKNEKYLNIFETGTWNGQGSTVCVMNAIINKPKSILYSLEANIDQYNISINYWKTNDTKNKLVLLNGVLHKDIVAPEDITKQNGTVCMEWYTPEIALLNSNNVLNLNDITNIDIIILDGGEYTTMGDYNCLIKKIPR